MQIKNLFVFATAVSAHFRLTYPLWRGDSLALSSPNNTISQWNYPCAGIGQETSSQNRTDWGLDGGAVRWNSSHEYAVTYINLGLGEVVKSFNISLLKAYNGTGAGQQCFSKLGQTALTKLNLTDGQPASIQVITTSSSGASLFNCADIVFRANAQTLTGNDCKNDTGVSGYLIKPAENASSTSSGASASGASKTGAAPRGAVPIAALMAAVGIGAYVAL